MKDVDLCLKWYGQVDITSKAIDEIRFVRFFVVVGTNCLIVNGTIIIGEIWMVILGYPDAIGL